VAQRQAHVVRGQGVGDVDDGLAGEVAGAAQRGGRVAVAGGQHDGIGAFGGRTSENGGRAELCLHAVGL
jgi:hypothetical protein